MIATYPPPGARTRAGIGSAQSVTTNPPCRLSIHYPSTRPSVRPNAHAPPPIAPPGRPQEHAPADLRLLARVLGELSNLRVQLGQPERGVELYTAALGAAEEAGDAERRMRVHGNLGLVLKELGELPQAEAQLQSTVDLAGELEDVFMEGRASMDLAAVHRARGDLGAALCALRRALALTEQMDDSEACG